MKKILTIIPLLCICLASSADVVPSSQAYEVARQFMQAEKLTEVWDGSEAETKAPQEPAFHVFNVEGGGWVIVSGDDCSVPILGFSRLGSFDKDAIPSNMRWWLGLMRDEILQARADGKSASADTKYKWSHPAGTETKAGTTVKVLETARWDQLAPYNQALSQYVKDRNGDGVENLFTGCVATSMAELLRYHRWPEHGTGTLPSYTTDSWPTYNVTGFSIDGHTYDWDNMPMVFDGDATEEQKAQVAGLMLDCGVMVKMDYGTGGSGAFTEDIIPALIEHMQYSKKAELKYRQYYSDAEWLQFIKYDIDNCGPILYAAVSTNNVAHQFLCDGYDMGEQRLHINWGWSGENNDTWFTLNLSIPNSYTFSKSQSAIFGLVPDRDGSSTYPDIELSLEPSGSYTGGVVLKSGSFASGQTFRINAGCFMNNNYTVSFTGAVKAVLVDRNGNWKEDASEAVEMVDELGQEGLGPRSLVWFEGSQGAIECSVQGSVSLGDRIEFWYRLNDGSWTPVTTGRSGLGSPWSLAYADACFIRTASSYRNGDRFTFTLVPGNKGISNVVWTYDGSQMSVGSVILTSGAHTVTAGVTFNDGTSETITQKLIVQ